jgi:hypothetical protein
MYYHGSRGYGDYDSYDSKDVQIDMDTRFRDSSDWQIFDKDTIYHKPSGLRFDVFYHEEYGQWYVKHNTIELPLYMLVKDCIVSGRCLDTSSIGDLPNKIIQCFKNTI